MASQQDGIKPEKTFQPLFGAGVLVVFGDIDSENEDEFNNWYTHQHLPERIGTPGFLRGRRFITVTGAENAPSSTYFAIYETETIDTLASAPYMLRLNNPSSWTKKVLPLFRNRRIACRVTTSIGAGTGGYAGTIEFRPDEGIESDLREWLRLHAMPSALELNPNLVSIHLMEEDESTTRAKDQTEEGKSRSSGRNHRLGQWMLMVEGISDAEIADTCRNLVSEMAAHGVNSKMSVNRYQLLVSLS